MDTTMPMANPTANLFDTSRRATEDVLESAIAVEQYTNLPDLDITAGQFHSEGSCLDDSGTDVATNNSSPADLANISSAYSSIGSDLNGHFCNNPEFDLNLPEFRSRQTYQLYRNDQPGDMDSDDCEGELQSINFLNDDTPRATVISSPTQEVSGRAIPSLSPHARPHVQLLRFRRDRMQAALEEMDTAIEAANREELEALQQEPSTILDPIASVVLAHINQNQADFTIEMAGYGNVLEKRNGSLIITLEITSLDRAKRLRKDYLDGTLFEKLKAWIMARCAKYPGVEAFTVDLNVARLRDIEAYLSADVMTMPLEYAFCPMKQKWYWTVDDVKWHNAEEFVIESSELSSANNAVKLRPQTEDEMILRRLLALNGDNNETFLKCLLGKDDSDDSNPSCQLCIGGVKHPKYNEQSMLKGPDDIDIVLKWHDEDDHCISSLSAELSAIFTDHDTDIDTVYISSFGDWPVVRPRVDICERAERTSLGSGASCSPILEDFRVEHTHDVFDTNRLIKP